MFAALAHGAEQCAVDSRTCLRHLSMERSNAQLILTHVAASTCGTEQWEQCAIYSNMFAASAHGTEYEKKKQI